MRPPLHEVRRPFWEFFIRCLPKDEAFPCCRVPQSGVQPYRRNLPHIQKDFTPHFITFCTKTRWILPSPARDITLESCYHDHRVHYELYVAVVMADHVHLILTSLIYKHRGGIFSLIRIMQSIKGASARAINQ